MRVAERRERGARGACGARGRTHGTSGDKERLQKQLHAEQRGREEAEDKASKLHTRLLALQSDLQQVQNPPPCPVQSSPSSRFSVASSLLLFAGGRRRGGGRRAGASRAQGARRAGGVAAQRRRRRQRRSRRHQPQGQRAQREVRQRACVLRVEGVLS
eukprot:2854680-Rhodomonas_salina.1